MPEVPYSKFRLGTRTLADLDALAASAGSRTQACREAVAYWRAAVEQAGRLNAEELSPAEWTLLAHLNDPAPLTWTWDEDERAAAHDWAGRLAQELAGMWEGRAAVLPEHGREREACLKLARRIAKWDAARGYALFACLRHFWARPESGAGGGDWWHPESWMTPEASAEN